MWKKSSTTEKEMNGRREKWKRKKIMLLHFGNLDNSPSLSCACHELTCDHVTHELCSCDHNATCHEFTCDHVMHELCSCDHNATCHELCSWDHNTLMTRLYSWDHNTLMTRALLMRSQHSHDTSSTHESTTLSWHELYSWDHNTLMTRALLMRSQHSHDTGSTHEITILSWHGLYSWDHNTLVTRALLMISITRSIDHPRRDAGSRNDSEWWIAIPTQLHN